MSEKYSREWWTERLHLIKAFSEGEVIQMLSGTVWEDVQTVGWMLPVSMYRIKPKTLKTRRYWWAPALGNEESTPFMWHEGRGDPSVVESMQGFCGWIDHDWVEIELPTGTKTNG